MKAPPATTHGIPFTLPRWKFSPARFGSWGSPSPTSTTSCKDVLLAAYESLDRFDPGWSPPEREAWIASHPPRRDRRRQHSSPEARWVFGIAWRKVSHHLDRAYRRREVPDGLRPASRCQAIDPAPLSEERIAEQERLEVAREVLLTIAPERRVLLVLHEAYEVPFVDIARELGLNYNTASNRLRLAREDYRAAVKRLRPERRQALRACWLVFPLASDFLVRDGGASAAVAPAGVPHAPVGPSLRSWLARLGRTLGSAAAGGAATAAVLLALAPSRPLWARRFDAALAYELPTTSAGLAAPPPQPSQQTPEPRPAAPAADAPARPARPRRGRRRRRARGRTPSWRSAGCSRRRKSASPRAIPPGRSGSSPRTRRGSPQAG
ncbi:RNA polymerase sigma factor [Sorangium sp. So ce363]|uniref:RNA polymerase sigma factor n=1 Tax=Sorangium sp. So ce363 TaxID=3133304 RepID=UPI003F5DC3DA